MELVISNKGKSMTSVLNTLKFKEPTNILRDPP